MADSIAREIVIDDAGYCELCEQDVGFAGVNQQIHSTQCKGTIETRPFMVEDLIRTVTYNLSFRQWKAMVNRAVVATCGLSCDDIGDAEYWDMWNSSTRPADAARQALEAADFPFDSDEDLD